MKLAQAPRARKHRWWNPTCDQAIDKRIHAWRLFSCNRTKENWDSFLKIQKQTSKTIRQQKRQHDKLKLEEIESDFIRNNTRNFYRTFRENMKGYQAPNLCFKRADGTLETNTKNNCNMLAEYFRNLLNTDPPTNTLHTDTPECNPDSEPPSRQEIEESIKSLKNNKAPGEDGIIAELWKLNDPQITEMLHGIITDIWTTETIPNDWKTAIVHPLHKKGDKTDPNNYRGISLLPVTYKILSKILLNRLESQTDHLIGEYQAGFRKGRSCSEQIWNLKMILQHKSKLVVTFVDFKKAYDSIDRQTLFRILREYKVDNKTRTLIEQTLTNTKSKVKFCGEISEPFSIHTGVRQGDGLSPLLFNLVLDKIIKEWERTQKGIKLGKTRVKCLAFADDLAILTGTTEEASKAIGELHDIASKTGLQISYEKTQYMSTHKIPHIDTKHGRVYRTEHFKYLGETLQITGLNRQSNEERRTKLEKAYKLTWKHYNKKSVSTRAKLRHYDTVVLPEALYAAETTRVLGRTQIKQIEAIERKILRKIFGATYRDGIWIRKPKEELYEQTEKITDKIRKRRMQFYGHLHRMNTNRLTKQILDEVKRRNKNKWLNEVQKDLESLGITTENIEDRPRFRLITKTSKLEELQRDATGNLKWTEERKQQHSAKLKASWAKKRGPKLKNKRKTTEWSEERKQKQSERMKAVWAAKKAKTSTS